jgi:dihydrofolate synthase/folylpolyglutamate synthase
MMKFCLANTVNIKFSAPNKNLEYLFNLERFGIKPSLENIRILCERLGHPERAFPAIHITGTNGKGTTSAVIHSVLVEAGYKVGLYTSPHLVKFGERIKIGQNLMSDEQAGTMIEELKPLFEEVGATFFECATAMAFLCFAREKVDLAVMEVGLGGTWDATNIIPSPLLCVFTSIALDHTDRLGNRPVIIAKDKAGIIKPSAIVVSARQDEEVSSVLRTRASELGCPFHCASEEIETGEIELFDDGSWVEVFSRREPQLSGIYRFPFPGRHQIDNLVTAICALSYLKQSGFDISFSIVKRAIEKVNWPGRLQVLCRSPLVYYDVGHNPSAVKAVCSFFQEAFTDRKIRLICGLARDKDAEGFITNLAPIASDFTFTELPTPRSRSPQELSEIAKAQNISIQVILNPEEAIKSVISSASRDSIILIIGSHYLGEAIYKKYLTKSK